MISPQPADISRLAPILNQLSWWGESNTPHGIIDKTSFYAVLEYLQEQQFSA